MNILHQKSWHVRTKQNIARVRRDEEKAAKEEQQREKKIKLAEQEARTQLLRDRAKCRLRDDDKIYEKSGLEPSRAKLQHIDFFSTSISENSTNTEREEDKKKEQQHFEKNIGLLRYLHEPTEEPWYRKSRTRESSSITKKHLAKQKTQYFQDPLRKMKEYTKKKTSSTHSKHKNTIKPHCSSSQSHSGQGKTIEQLRAERLERERGERYRAEMLLNKSKKPLPEIVTDDRNRQYNSAFNPELSRQERWRNK